MENLEKADAANGNEAQANAPSTVAVASCTARQESSAALSVVSGSDAMEEQEKLHFHSSSPKAKARRRGASPDEMTSMMDPLDRKTKHDEKVPKLESQNPDPAQDASAEESGESVSYSPASSWSPSIHLRTVTSKEDGKSIRASNQQNQFKSSTPASSGKKPLVQIRSSVVVEEEVIMAQRKGRQGVHGHNDGVVVEMDYNTYREPRVYLPPTSRNSNSNNSNQHERRVLLPGATRVPGIGGDSRTRDEALNIFDDLSSTESVGPLVDETTTPFPAIRVGTQQLNIAATNVQVINSPSQGLSPGGKHWVKLAVACGGLVVILVACSVSAILFLLASIQDSRGTAVVTAPSIEPTQAPSLRSSLPTPSPTAIIRRVISDREELLEAIREYVLALNDGRESELDPIEYWNVSAVTDMSAAFSSYRYPVIGGIFNSDISRWDVSNVESMVDLFAGARRFNQNLSRWKTSKVTSLKRAFFEAEAFEGKIKKWNTRRVQSLEATFHRAYAFNGDLSRWDVSQVTTLRYTFTRATAFNRDISCWNVTGVTSLHYTFGWASAFGNQGIKRWDVSNVNNMRLTFRHTFFNGNIGRWNTSRVTNMKRMFARAVNFDKDISRWDVAKTENMHRMFSNAVSFNRPLKWDTRSLRDAQGMFQNASSFNSELHLDLSQVEDLSYFFQSAVSFNQNISHWNVSKVLYMNAMINESTGFDQDLSSWDVRNVQEMDRMFAGARAFNGDVTTWRTDSLRQASAMFAGAVSFNQDISSWNISRLTNTTGFLVNATSFRQNMCSWHEQLGARVSDWTDIVIPSNTSC